MRRLLYIAALVTILVAVSDRAAAGDTPLTACEDGCIQLQRGWQSTCKNLGSCQAAQKSYQCDLDALELANACQKGCRGLQSSYQLVSPRACETAMQRFATDCVTGKSDYCALPCWKAWDQKQQKEIAVCAPTMPGKNLNMDSRCEDTRKDVLANCELMTDPGGADAAGGRGPISFREFCERYKQTSICQGRGTPRNGEGARQPPKSGQAPEGKLNRW